MNIIIVGSGKLGYSLAKQLAGDGYDIVMVDSNRELLNKVTDNLDVACVCGNGINSNVLEEAGAKTADLLIAATSNDEVNILSCLFSKKIGVKHTIARVRDPEYIQSTEMLRDELGLSMIINPENTAATKIARTIRFPSSMKVDYLARGRLELAEYVITEDSVLNNCKLSQIYTKLHARVLICVIQRGKEVIIPRGDFVLEEGDVITLTGSPMDIATAFRGLGFGSGKPRTVLIVGADRTAYYLIQELLSAGIHVKVLEKNKDRCEQLAEYFPKAVILHGDGADQKVLEEENAADMDALVALTALDEENVVISMYAAAVKVPKIITKVTHINFGEVLQMAGIQEIVTPHVIAANRIETYVRAMQRSEGGNMEALTRILDGRVEALEFLARDGFKGLDKPLKELKLRNDLMLCSLVRKRKLIFPNGDTTIQKGDTVVVVTTSNDILELNDIFA